VNFSVKTLRTDESSRAVPTPDTAELYQDTYNRFKGLTQRLATGGLL